MEHAFQILSAKTEGRERDETKQSVKQVNIIATVFVVVVVVVSGRGRCYGAMVDGAAVVV